MKSQDNDLRDMIAPMNELNYTPTRTASLPALCPSSLSQHSCRVILGAVAFMVCPFAEDASRYVANGALEQISSILDDTGGISGVQKCTACRSMAVRAVFRMGVEFWLLSFEVDCQLWW